MFDDYILLYTLIDTTTHIVEDLYEGSTYRVQIVSVAGNTKKDEKVSNVIPGVNSIEFNTCKHLFS